MNASAARPPREDYRPRSARVQHRRAAGAGRQQLLHRCCAPAGGRTPVGHRGLRAGCHRGTHPVGTAADRDRRLRRVHRPQLAASRQRRDRGAPQANPSGTLRAGGSHRQAGQRFHRAVPDAGGGPRHLSAQGPRHVRVGGRPVVLLTDPAVGQREPRLELLGDPVAQPGPRRHRRPPPGGLLLRRIRARGVRQTGRTRLARVHRVPGPGTVSRRPPGRDDDGHRRGR